MGPSSCVYGLWSIGGNPLVGHQTNLSTSLIALVYEKEHKRFAYVLGREVERFCAKAGRKVKININLYVPVFRRLGARNKVNTSARGTDGKDRAATVE